MVWTLRSHRFAAPHRPRLIGPRRLPRDFKTTRASALSPENWGPGAKARLRVEPVVAESFGAQSRRNAPVCGVEALGSQTPCCDDAVTAKRPQRSGGAPKALDSDGATWPHAAARLAGLIPDGSGWAYAFINAPSIASPNVTNFHSAGTACAPARRSGALGGLRPRRRSSPKPARQSRFRLMPQPQPGELDHRRAQPRIAGFRHPLLVNDGRGARASPPTRSKRRPGGGCRNVRLRPSLAIFMLANSVPIPAQPEQHRRSRHRRGRRPPRLPPPSRRALLSSPAAPVFS